MLDSSVSISTAQKAALAVIAQAPGVIAEPAPASRVIEYGPNGSRLLFLGWVNQRESDLLRVRSNCIRAVKGEFKELGFDLYTRAIVVRHPGEAAAAAEPNAAALPAGAPIATPVAAAVAAPAAPEADHADVDVSVNRDIDQTVQDTRQEVQQATLVR